MRPFRLEGSAGHAYLFSMVIASIRDFNRAVPFVPYEIRMAGGEVYAVPHPDFILVSPTGAYVIVIDSKDRPHHLNAILIERVSPKKGSARGAAKKR